MEYVLEHFGCAVGAITGVLAGKGKRVDLFGGVVLALVTALGGGTARDVILGLSPVFWIKDPNFVLTATAAALLTFVLVRFREMPEKLLLIADAFALAFFTLVGVEKALRTGASDSIAIVLGVTTGVAGGMIRDVLVGEIPLVFRKQIYLYATASVCGAAVFVLLEHRWPGQPVNRLLAAGGTLALRLAAIQWKISLPLLTSRPK